MCLNHPVFHCLILIGVLCTSDAFARGRRFAAPSSACADGSCSAPAVVEVPVTVEVGPPSIAPPAPVQNVVAPVIAPPPPTCAQNVVLNEAGCQSTNTKKVFHAPLRRVTTAGLCAKAAKLAVRPLRIVKPVLRCVGKLAVKPLRLLHRRR